MTTQRLDLVSKHRAQIHDVPESPAPQPIVTRMTITPAMAADWLENTNFNNRRIIKAHVQRLARDMANGEWVLSHQGIAFDCDGVLLDGQHRLRAVVISETPVEMHVWRNVTPDALMAIDSGKIRSLFDILTLNNEHQVDKAGLAVLRAMLGGFNGPIMSLTVTEADEAILKHIDAITFAVKVLPKTKRIVDSTIRAVIARAYYCAVHDRLVEFSRMLSTGVVPDEDAFCVIMLRQFLDGHSDTSRATRFARYAKTERALMAYLDHETLSRLCAATKEQFLLPEEQTQRRVSYIND